MFRSQGPTRREAGTVRLWNIDGTAGPVITGDFRGIHALAWTPDGRQIVFGGRDESIWMWDAALPTVTKKFTIHGVDINSLAWNADATQLLATSRAAMVVWKSDGSLRRTLRGVLNGPRFTHVCFSPDGKWIASLGRLWQVDGTPGPALPDAEQPMIWSPDGKGIAGAGPNMTVQLWNENFAKDRPLTRHHRYISSLDWSPDGSQVASTSGDGLTRIWDLSNDTMRTLRSIDESARQYRSVEFSPNGRFIAATSWGDASVHIWDQSGNIRALLKGHRGGVESVSWSPDGARLVTGGGLTVRLWESDGTPVRVLEGHASEVYPVAWSPDGKWIASGDTDGTIRLWHPSGHPGPTLVGHFGGIHSLSWSPDSKHLASASWLDGTIRMWNVETQLTEWTLLLVDDAGTTATLSPSGELLHDDRQLVKDELLYLRETVTGIMSTLTFAEFHDRHADVMIRYLGDLGILAARRGEHEKAVLRCRQMISYGCDKSDGTLRKCIAAVEAAIVESRQYHSVATILSALIQHDRKLIASYGDEFDATNLLIDDLARRYDFYLLLKKYPQAMADAEEMQQRQPANSLGYYLSGQLLWNLDRFSPALDGLKKAYELAPDQPKEQIAYAFALANRPMRTDDEVRFAEFLARRAIEGDPKWGTAWRTYGMVQYRLGNWQASIDAHNKAIELEGGDYHITEYLFMAMANYRLGKIGDAEIWYERSIEWINQNSSNSSDVARWRSEVVELLGLKNTPLQGSPDIGTAK